MKFTTPCFVRILDADKAKELYRRLQRCPMRSRKKDITEYEHTKDAAAVGYDGRSGRPNEQHLVPKNFKLKYRIRKTA